MKEIKNNKELTESIKNGNIFYLWKFIDKYQKIKIAMTDFSMILDSPIDPDKVYENINITMSQIRIEPLKNNNLPNLIFSLYSGIDFTFWKLFELDEIEDAEEINKYIKMMVATKLGDNRE